MPELVVDAARIRANAEIVRKAAGTARVIGVVKGNGYGLGLVPYARILAACGADMLAAADLEEALQLRAAGLETEILLLSPLREDRDIRAAAARGVTMTIASAEDARRTQQVCAAAGLTAAAHLYVDTGLGRPGLPAGDGDAALDAARLLRGVALTGIYSHFSEAACGRRAATLRQLRSFLAVCRRLAEAGVDVGTRHIAASCALLRYPETRLDAVRVGSAFLGRLPMENVWGFQPVGVLRCRVDQVYTLPAGSRMGYGGGCRLRRETEIAQLPAGYGSGFGLRRARQVSSLPEALREAARLSGALLRGDRLSARIAGRDCPILGPVGFTSCAADVTGAGCRPGDRAELPVNPLTVNSRVRRVYIGAGELGETACRRASNG